MTGRPIAALVLPPLLAFGLGYWVAPKEQLDEEAKHTGFFRVDTSKVLRATIESLREENRLLVYSYKGSASVRAARTDWLILSGTQELNVPAVVNYYVDLSGLTLADVTYEEKARLVRVKLPKLQMGDVAFQPENATTINGGILTFSESQVEDLRKLNYAKARRAMVAQAQQPGLINAAKRQARANIESYFAIPLRIAGQPDVKVVATF